MTVRKQWIITAILFILFLTFAIAAWVVSFGIDKTNGNTEQSTAIATKEVVTVLQIPTSTATTTPSPTFSVVFQ